jgi:peptidoglycan/xylan/chitin deacetylase (PgdA/CDA1 family)
MNRHEKFGALVISLDFEIHWGVRDYKSPDGDYSQLLFGERESVPAMLEIFKEFGIAATWATVGFLFAKSRDDLTKYKPKILPNYKNTSLFPYNEKIGENESEDLLHYAPNLIEQIQKVPRQEIGTHTFSHYYCLDSGQTAETFAADLQSAIAIAKPYGISLKSIVFPRNQHNPDYEEILLQNGILCFRGNQQSWMYQVSENNQKKPFYRAARLADAYINLSGHNTAKWEEIWKQKVANVPASFFLRPFSKRLKRLENLRLKRLTQSIKYAAKNKEIFHLWWHPHNFGVNLTENLNFLRRVLEVYKKCENDYEMQSLSISETAEKALVLSK